MKDYELKNIAYPAIFEIDKNDDRFYNIYFPDLNLNIKGLGYEDATLKAQYELGRVLKNSNASAIKKPSTRDELIKIYPHKRMYNVTPFIDEFGNKKTSPSTHYLTLKIAKSSETNFNAGEVKEVVDPFNKIILFLTLLKHCEVEDGYAGLILENEQCKDNANCKKYNNSKNCKNAEILNLHNMLYSLKYPLIEEYARLENLNKEKETEFIDNIINNQNSFSCCLMFNMGNMGDIDDCMCGFYSYKAIKEQLDELNCFDNVGEFVKKFLSPEYKFVAQKVKMW